MVMFEASPGLRWIRKIEKLDSFAALILYLFLSWGEYDE